MQDVEGYSKGTFRVLHDMRGLSVHFMLDLDGTIYQTLDLKVRGHLFTCSFMFSCCVRLC